MEKIYYVVECAELLAFEHYKEAHAYCKECFDNFYTPKAFKRESVKEYNEEYKNALIMQYNNGKLFQVGCSPLSLL